MNSLRLSTLTAIVGCILYTQATAQNAIVFRGAALQQVARISHLTRKTTSPETIDAFSPNTYPNGTTGAFYQQNLQWDVEQLKQIEFSLKTDAPGYFQFASSCVKDGTRASLKTSPLSAIPDGEFHTYIVDLTKEKNAQGIMTNYEIRWLGEPANLSWRSVRALTIANRIPDADNLPPGVACPVAKLMPRAACTLSWHGGASPGTTLRFYDRDGRELPGSAVELPAGTREIHFTTPEYMIEATVTVAAQANGCPVLSQDHYTPPGAPGKLFWRGSWLWLQNAPGPINRHVWFQRDFELEQAPETAIMGVLGDDCCYTYVNGHFLGKTIRWSQAARYDIAKHLRKGRNRISCRVTNIDSWGGFLADVYVRTGGQDLYLDSDASWRCEYDSNTDTSIPEANAPAVVLGDACIAPWHGGMAYRYAGPQGVLHPLRLAPGKMTVRVESLPVAMLTTLRFVTIDEQNRKMDFTLPISPDSSQWRVGQEITISYPLPYVDHGRSVVCLEDDLVQLPNTSELAVIDKGAITPPPLRRAQWCGGNRPMLQLGDDIIQPVFCHAPSAYGHDHLVWVTRCANNNFRSYRIAAFWQDYWQPDGSFDFSAFDKDVATLLTHAPDAVFAVHVYSFMPEWWLQRNPDDLSRHYRSDEHPRDLWLDKQALGSEKWLTEGEIPLKALIDHIKASGYADRVWGLSFCENNCGEMFWTSADANGKLSYAGYSPADYAAFRKFLRRKYADDSALAAAWRQPGLTFDTVEMPWLENARKGNVGTLLDPVQSRQMMDFCEFRSLTVANALIHFGRFTKEQTDGKWLVGAYYGYFSEMIANPRRNIQSNGHNGFLETAQSPYVDFVHAPLRYALRKTGQPGTMMQVWDSYLLRGKMIFTELDVRTSLSPVEEPPANKIYCGTPDTPFCDIGQFYRSFGMMAATGSLCYWYDLNTRQFDEKSLNAAISAINDAYLSLGPVKGTTPCEVAIVSDRDSAYYSQFPSPDNPSTIASEQIFRHFNELAVPFKSLTITDLLDSAIHVQPFKCYIMLPTLMLSQETRQRLLQRFTAEGATVVWLYTAGASYPGHGPSAQNCGDFLGLQCQMETTPSTPRMVTTADYGSLDCTAAHQTCPLFLPTAGYDAVVGQDTSRRPLMVRKQIGSSQHYFTTLPNLPMELFANILARAGVWRYSQTTGPDQYWLGNDVLFVHAVTNGAKSFRLPQGCHARPIIGPCQKTLASGEHFAARSGMTYGFVIEKD